MYKQILINAKLQIGKRVQNTELTERSPLMMCRSTVDSSVIEEDCQRDLSLINQLRGGQASVDTVALTCANIKIPSKSSTTKSIKCLSRRFQLQACILVFSKTVISQYPSRALMYNSQSMKTYVGGNVKTVPLKFQQVNVVSVHAINPLKPELNPICYLLALLGAHHFLHVSRIRVINL